MNKKKAEPVEQDIDLENIDDLEVVDDTEESEEQEAEESEEEEQSESDDDEEEGADEEESSESDEEDDNQDDVELLIGDEESPPQENANESSVIKQLRKANREKDKQLKAFRAQQQAPEAPSVGDKPTMESCEYDEAKFEAALSNWHAQKRKVEEHGAQEAEEQRKAEEDQQQRVAAYEQSKGTLGVKDFDDAEDAVKAELSELHQTVLIRATNDPARVVYALGKRPEIRQAISQLNDPLAIAAELGRLEATIKLKPATKAKPKAQRQIKGSGTVTKSHLLKQLDKAYESNNVSQALKIKAKLRSAGHKI